MEKGVPSHSGCSFLGFTWNYKFHSPTRLLEAYISRAISRIPQNDTFLSATTFLTARIPVRESFLESRTQVSNDRWIVKSQGRVKIARSESLRVSWKGKLKHSPWRMTEDEGPARIERAAK